MLHSTAHFKAEWVIRNFIPSTKNVDFESESFYFNKPGKDELQMIMSTNVVKNKDNEDRFVSLLIILTLRNSSEHDDNSLGTEIYIKNADNKNILMKSNLTAVDSERLVQRQVFWIPLSDIFDDRNKFLKENSLTFVLHFSVYYETTFPEAPKYSKLFNSNKLSDFKIKCNDRDIPAHRAILYEKCEVFARMLDTPMEESTSNEVEIDDLNGAVALELIRYIYTESVENIDEIAMDLLNAAEKYQLPDLKLKCVKSCSKNMDNANVFKMLILADRFGEKTLMKNCISYIRLHYDDLKYDDKWSLLDKDLFIKLVGMSECVKEWKLYHSIPERMEEEENTSDSDVEEVEDEEGFFHFQ